MKPIRLNIKSGKLEVMLYGKTVELTLTDNQNRKTVMSLTKFQTDKLITALYEVMPD